MRTPRTARAPSPLRTTDGNCARVFAALMLCTSVASAAPPPADVARARAIYEEATAKYNVGEWRPALDGFKAAYLITRDGVLLFNMAQCYRQLGQPESAALMYRAYLRETPDAPNREDVRRLTTEMERATAEKRAQQPPTALVQRHGEPGSALTREAPPDPRARRRRAEGIASVSLLGVGVVGVVAGGTLLGYAASLHYGPGAPIDEILRIQNARQTDNIAGGVVFAIGAAALVGSGVTFALWMRDRRLVIRATVWGGHATSIGGSL